MITLVAIIVWRLNPVIVLAIFLPFATLDGLFLSSALTKVPDGAWFTIMLAIVLASIFILWRFGKEQQWASEARDRLPTKGIIVHDANTGKEMLHSKFGGGELTRIKGLGIFFDKAGHAIPTVYAQFLQKFEARPNVHVFLQLRALSLPSVDEHEKYAVSEVEGIDDCYRVVVRHGYNDEIVTKELGGVVYTNVRAFIVRSACIRGRRREGGTKDCDEAEAAAVTGVEQQDKGRPSAAEDAASQKSDSETARKLRALDEAYATQIVYIVGKEQLRFASGVRRSWKKYVGRAAFRRIVLEVFMWIRENTRAKVASMRIPVEKLVEVGFVKEI